MPDLSETIEELAALPEESVVDGQKVKERPLADVIAADEYLAAREAAATPTRGIGFTKLNPPGSV